MLGYLVIHGGSCSTCFFDSPNQDTPLNCAAWRGHVVVVRCLVEKGADMNIKDDKFGVSEWECTANCNLYFRRLSHTCQLRYCPEHSVWRVPWSYQLDIQTCIAQIYSESLLCHFDDAVITLIGQCTLIIYMWIPPMSNKDLSHLARVDEHNGFA